MAEHSSSSTPRCVLDDNNCLSLYSILSSFNTPINEEQAWAVCYQCAKCLHKEWEKDQHTCFVLNDLGQILIHKDGIIHPNTKSVTVSGKSRTKPLSEEELSSSLGLLIFHALDYGLPEDEERPLSAPLEHLIELMTATNGNTSNDQNTSRDCDRHDADEGIERDSEEYEASDIRLVSGVSFAKVMEVCASHLHIPSQADSHYKAVCRALVAEALELSTFLQKITQGKEELNELRKNTPDESDGADLEQLKFSDWARLWVQVIRDLRHGVKLKKVVIENLPPNEYELTPYEILMDDIRSRRYKLNKVMVNGDLPQRVKKDAHNVILEFIRSRPPLHPVADRKLKPIASLPSSPYEALMKSIRQKHRLKKTPSTKTVETSRTQAGENDATPQSTRRLIKVDMSLIVDTDDDDDLELPSSPCEEGKKRLTFEDDYKSPAENRNSKGMWKRTVALDLATNESSFKPERRHSITVCESPIKPPNVGSGEVVVSPTATFSGAEQPVSLPVQLSTCETITLKTTTLFFQSNHFKNSMECLSLTLEEVVHIRNVLTKAELESLLVDKALYEEVAKGKICFTCKKTKFSFFGAWGQKCRLCQRNVCEKCCAKMRIPTEHFASIPVFTLSPGSTSSTEDESSKSLWKLPDVSFLTRRMSVGSAPSSPNLSTKNGHPVGSPNSVNSSPAATPMGTSLKRRPLLRSRTLNRADSVRREKLCGELMTVCKECRAVVKHAIVANRQSLQLHQKKVLTAANGNMANGKSSPSSSRHIPPSRDLHLNLSPIY